MLDWASHTRMDYTTNAGEHFSLSAHGSVLAIPRIFFWELVAQVCVPQQGINFCDFGKVALDRLHMERGPCASARGLIPRFWAGSAGCATSRLGAVALTQGHFIPT